MRICQKKNESNTVTQRFNNARRQKGGRVETEAGCNKPQQTKIKTEGRH